MNELGTETYVRLTTFTKDGRPKPTPVWIADLGDGTLGFTTALDSWKVKRIRNVPAVEIVASDARGNPTDAAPTVHAVASVRTGADLAPVQQAIKAKYGWQYTAIGLVERAKRLGRSRETCGVVLTIED